MVIDDHDVVVAGAGGDDEPAGLVGVDLAGGLDVAGGVMECSIAKVGASPVGWAGWECVGVGCGIVGQGERGRGAIVNCLIVALGRPLALAGLV
jgi:hypothetical protein